MKKALTLVCTLMTMVLLTPVVSAHERHGHEKGKSLLISFAGGLPLEEGVYIPEIEKLVKRGIVDRYGTHEFEATILAHELHGHLGDYTIIGVKMGILALEFLEAPRNAVTIETECKRGSSYPLPCINDGITAATLCSMNNGKMRLSAAKPDYATTFGYEGEFFRISLRDHYRRELEDRIDGAVKKYKKEGKFTPPYWKEVRKMAWWAWEEWDRNKIFKIEKIK